MSSIPRSDWDWRDPDRDRRQHQEERDRRQRQDDERDAVRRRNTHSAQSCGTTSSGSSIDIFELIKILILGLFHPFRYGYAMRLLLWAFVVPLLLMFGWVVVDVALKIHAEPQVFLAHWQAHVIRNPGAAHWTWAIRDFVDLCRW